MKDRNIFRIVVQVFVKLDRPPARVIMVPFIFVSPNMQRAYKKHEMDEMDTDRIKYAESMNLFRRSIRP